MTRDYMLRNTANAPPRPGLGGVRSEEFSKGLRRDSLPRLPNVVVTCTPLPTQTKPLTLACQHGPLLRSTWSTTAAT